MAGRKAKGTALAVASTVVKATAGRPTLYAPHVMDYICQELSKGIPLTRICAGGYEPGEDDLFERPVVMPKPRTVRDWEAEDPTIAAQVARAREAGEEALFEQCLEISDDETHDWVASKKGLLTNEVNIARAKLRVWTRMEMLKRINPRKYGDRQQIEHSGKIALESLVAGDGEQ